MSWSATASAATMPAVEALVDRYAAAVAPVGQRVVGRLTGDRATNDGDERRKRRPPT